MANLEKKPKKIVALITTIFLTGLLASCAPQTAQMSGALTYTTEYSAAEDTTHIIWKRTIDNTKSIYNIERIAVTFRLFNDEVYLRNSERLEYEVNVNHGKTYTRNYDFTAAGEIDEIEIISWGAKYSTLWNTYLVWFIAGFVFLGLVVLLSAIIIFVKDYELDDLGSWLGEQSWILYALLPLLVIGGVVGIIFKYWLLVLFILSVFIASALLILLVFGVKALVDYLKDLVSEKPLVNEPALNSDNNIEEDDEAPPDQGNEEVRRETPIFKGDKEGITFADIAGLFEAKEAVKEKIILPVTHKELFKKYDKKAGGGILLYGLPGTGKTMFAEAVANEINAKFFPIKCSDIKSKWYGESEQRVKKLFADARKAGRAVIFFDEFEAIGRKRSESEDSANNDLVPEILSQIQGINKKDKDAILLIIAATNRPWDIDSALMRPGRFEEKIYIPLPDFAARKKLFEMKLAKVPLTEEVKIDYLATITEGYNGSDVNEFCEKLKLQIIKRTIDSKEELPITLEDVAIIKDKVKTSVHPQDIKRLKQFQESL